MSFQTNEFVRAEARDKINIMEVTESMAIPKNPGVSENFGVRAKGFDSKNCFSNKSDPENVAPKQPGITIPNTSIEFLYRKDSEEEFTTWPKRRIKLQGGRVVGDEERVSDEMDITSECHEHLKIPTIVSDNKQHLETQHKYVTDDTKMECTSNGSFCNLLEECSSNSENLFGNDAITSITEMESIAGTHALNSNTGIRKHILDLPDLVLEHILGYVDLKDLSQKVRPVCRTFYTLCSRILRLAFKNIHTELSSTLQKLEYQHPCDWRPICAEMLTCKMLQSEMNTLRAACSRQIESGHFCFIHGDVLQNYHNILHAVQDETINVMLDGISDTFIKLNEKALKYWDTRYDDEDMALGEMKLLGVEIIELLLSAFNASGCIVIEYKPSFKSASRSDDTEGEDTSGSCMMAGCVSINHSTELMPNLTENISVREQREEILKYIRAIVRANNCDIVLFKLRTYSKEMKAPLPVFEHRAWNLCNSEVHHNLVEESYKKDPVIDHTDTPVPDSNMHLICNFEMICPKRINPFGIASKRWHQSLLSSEVVIKEEKAAHATNLAEFLSGDHYIFNMELKTWICGSSQEHSIAIENYITKANKRFLNINSNCSSAHEST